jgi:phosphoribosylanthranilate isomerase
MTRIKICGLCREEDARTAAREGADYLGFVLAASPRRCDARVAAAWLPPMRAEFPGVGLVGVFVRPAAAEVREQVEALGLDYVQLHGLPAGQRFDSPRPLIRAIAPGEAGRC